MTMGRAIDLYARPTPGFEDRVARSSALLQHAAAEHAGHIVQATSLGVEDMVVTDLLARLQLPVALAMLDTGQLHTQTLAMLPRIEARYGLRVERWQPPAAAVMHFVGRHGEGAMFDSVALRKACCALRKLEPLGRLLAGRSAWITGLRREQSGARGDVPFSETDGPGRTKFNPLADWTLADVWHYVALHDVPTNPLHDEFFPSIGCAPCTRAVTPGEDIRAGRWWWEQDGAKECGLHVHEAAAALDT
jgi:phosphoadenosine phosphosulfate reductase